ncbi:hypothetical protein P9112_007923 [Eukaryota sp. TZLM1-RC]
MSFSRRFTLYSVSLLLFLSLVVSIYTIIPSENTVLQHAEHTARLVIHDHLLHFADELPLQSQESLNDLLAHELRRFKTSVYTNVDQHTNEITITIHYKTSTKPHTFSINYADIQTAILERELYKNESFQVDKDTSLYLSQYKWSVPALLHLKYKLEAVQNFMKSRLSSDTTIESLELVNITQQFNEGRICKNVDQYEMMVKSNDTLDIMIFEITLTSKVTRVATFWIWTPLVILLASVLGTTLIICVQLCGSYSGGDVDKDDNCLIAIAVVFLILFCFFSFFAPLKFFEHYCSKELVVD